MSNQPQEIKLTHTDIVNKLIGPIQPIGKSEVDADRFENLKNICDLVNNLVIQIKNVQTDKFSHEASVREAGKYADKFLYEIGIKEE